MKTFVTIELAKAQIKAGTSNGIRFCADVTLKEACAPYSRSNV